MDEGQDPVSTDMWLYLGCTAVFLAWLGVRFYAQFRASVFASENLHDELMDRSVVEWSGRCWGVILLFTTDLASTSYCS